MHCPISLLVFTLVAVAASGAVDGSTIKGSSDLQIIAASKAVRSGAKRMTNAQRLAMNLPPLKPKRLYSGTRVMHPRHSETSPLPAVSKKCNIQVFEGDPIPENALGYISPDLSTSGYYSAFQLGQVGAMEVTFSYAPDDSAPSQLELLVVNATNTTYPYLGIAANSGSPNSKDQLYVILTGTSRIPVGSPSGTNLTSTAEGVEVESAVWNYDPTTQVLTPQWITDESASVAYIRYCPSSSEPLGGTTGHGVQESRCSSVATFTCVDQEAP